MSFVTRVRTLSSNLVRAGSGVGRFQTYATTHAHSRSRQPRVCDKLQITPRIHHDFNGP